MSSAKDHLELIRKAETNGANYDIMTEDVLKELTRWQTLCLFEVLEASYDRADIRFHTLPADMDTFVRDLYNFCPDLVDQGTGCIAEMLEGFDEVPPEFKELVEGVDMTKDDYGLEILKRELQRSMRVLLWWD